MAFRAAQWPMGEIQATTSSSVLSEGWSTESRTLRSSATWTALAFLDDLMIGGSVGTISFKWRFIKHR